MQNLIKKLSKMRRNHRENIWLMHIIIIATIFICSYFKSIDFITSLRILTLLYTGFCIYFIVSFKKRLIFNKKIAFVLYAISVQSLFFIIIELTEEGLNYFHALILLNILLCLFAINKEVSLGNRDGNRGNRDVHK